MKLVDKYLKEGKEMDFTWELMGNQMDDFVYKLLKMETPPKFERDYDKVTKQYQMFKKQLERFIKSISN